MQQSSKFISITYHFFTLTGFIGRHDAQQVGIRSRRNSVIKCAIESINGSQQESKCGLCVRWDRSKGKSVYMKKKSQNETSCPPSPQPTEKGNYFEHKYHKTSLFDCASH